MFWENLRPAFHTEWWSMSHTMSHSRASPYNWIVPLRLTRAIGALRGQSYPLLGPPSLHVGVVQGGTGPSTYAARCRVSVEARLITRLARPSFEVRPDGALAAAVEGAAREVLRRAVVRVGLPFWTDAALCAEAGSETIVIGPVGAGAHETEEWVDLDSCAHFAEILARAALAYCGTG